MIKVKSKQPTKIKRQSSDEAYFNDLADLDTEVEKVKNLKSSDSNGNNSSTDSN